MRRVWAAVLSVWALLALVAVIAWSRPAAQPSVRTVVVRTVNGGRRTVVLSPPPHATTQTSPGTAQPSVVVSGQGPVVVRPGAGGGND